MARLWGKVADAISEFYIDCAEGYAMLYLMAVGAAVHVGAVAWCLYWLIQHVRFV